MAAARAGTSLRLLCTKVNTILKHVQDDLIFQTHLAAGMPRQLAGQL